MSETINFFNEEIDFSLNDENKTKNWILEIASQNKYKINNINYVFCSDEYLLQVNIEHLNHNYYTDIITFDLSEKEDEIESDIFISIDRVTENAVTNNNTFDKELLRVIIHGLLHLIGYNDKSNEEKLLMRKKEEECISLYL